MFLDALVRSDHTLVDTPCSKSNPSISKRTKSGSENQTTNRAHCSLYYKSALRFFYVESVGSENLLLLIFLNIDRSFLHHLNCQIKLDKSSILT
ncbi:hypothetical protein [Enterococcus hirae]|uniref:hypothetical protein n=1 Tax=Enterococcus hirae TaxID=1354 RepID=UPI0038600A68